MSESKKILIAFVVVGFICCVMAGVGYWGLRQFGNRVEQMANGDPTAVAQMREKIADFDVPPGYNVSALSMVIYDTVTLTPDGSGSGGPMILLMQYNSVGAASREQIEQSLREAAQSQGLGGGASMQVVDSFETTIRGETATVTVSEGEFQGLPLRQWVAIFDGNKGPVIFMAQGIAEEWDDRLLEDFIRSIR